MRRQVRRHLVHEKQQFELTVSRLLGQHPIVQLPGEFLNEVLLLLLVLNRVEVHDVQRHLAMNGRLNKRIDVNGYAVGKEQLVHAAREGSQTTAQFEARGFGQPLFKIGQPVFHHDFCPCGRFHGLFSFFDIHKTLGVQVLGERQVWVTNHLGEGLEIVNIQPRFRAFDQDFVQKRLDGLPLGFFHIVPSEVGEASRHHVPRCDRFFRVQISRRSSKRVDAERQPLAAQRRPHSNFTHVEQLLGSRHVPVLALEFVKVNAQRQTSEVALWIDDKGRDACQRRFFDEGLGHHGFPRAGGTQHGTVARQHLRGDVHRFLCVPTVAQQHPLWFVRRHR